MGVKDNMSLKITSCSSSKQLDCVDASTAREQRDSTHSLGPISETRPPGGHGSVHGGGLDDSDVLDGYINNTLAQKFNDPTFNDPPLATHICPKSKSSRATSLVLNDIGER